MAHSNKRLITFLMTTACNLRCTYCITSSMQRQNPGHCTRLRSRGAG